MPVGRLLLIGLLLAGAWLASLALYDAEKTRDAARERAAVLAGDTPYRWSFSSRFDIDGGHGLRRFDWDGETLRGRGDHLYFYLNLQSRHIDPDRYARIRIRLHSGQASQLRLYFSLPGEAAIHAGEPVPVAAGWQTLEIDLAELWWGRKDLNHPERLDTPSGWGQSGQAVRALRIDPVVSGTFAVDEVALLPRADAPPYGEGVQAIQGLDDPVFEELRQAGIRNPVLAQQGAWRTPESATWQRRQIAAAWPAAIVFPRLPGERDLRPAERRAGPGALTVLALATAGLLLLLRGRTPARWRGLSEVMVLCLLVEVAIYWAPALPVAARWLAGLLLLGLLWWLRPVHWRGLAAGDARAWAWLAPLLLVPVAALVYVQGADLEAARLARLLGLYFLWALLQQYLVAVVVFERLRASRAKYAVVLAAAVFGLLHLPNFTLMAGTFLLGMLWLEVYRRHRNLPAIAASHAMLAVCATELLPAWLLLSSNVGVAYLATL